MKHAAEDFTVGRDIGRDGEVGNGKAVERRWGLGTDKADAVERSWGLGTDETDAGDSPHRQRQKKTGNAILGH